MLIGRLPASQAAAVTAAMAQQREQAQRAAEQATAQLVSGWVDVGSLPLLAGAGEVDGSWHGRLLTGAPFIPPLDWIRPVVPPQTPQQQKQLAQLNQQAKQHGVGAAVVAAAAAVAVKPEPMAVAAGAAGGGGKGDGEEAMMGARPAVGAA
jgi:hypothetical protein